MGSSASLRIPQVRTLGARPSPRAILRSVTDRSQLRVQLWSYNYEPEPAGIGPVSAAGAKGLRERGLVVRHAMKNALIPVVTIVGLQVGAIIEGAVITEQIFFWPGVGKLVVDSIAGRDYPVVQGVVMLSAFSFMLATLVVDVLYGVLDPRISYSRKSS